MSRTPPDGQHEAGVERRLVREEIPELFILGLFVAAAVRHLIDAWRKPRVSDKAVAGQFIACAGFVVCVYLAVCLRIFGELQGGRD